MKLNRVSIMQEGGIRILPKPLSRATRHLRSLSLQGIPHVCEQSCIFTRTYNVPFTSKLRTPWFCIQSWAAGSCVASESRVRICIFSHKGKSHVPSIFCKVAIFPYPSLQKICNNRMLVRFWEKKKLRLKKSNRGFCWEACSGARSKGFGRYYSAYVYLDQIFQ